jgi:hypothetical protein
MALTMVVFSGNSYKQVKAQNANAFVIVQDEEGGAVCKMCVEGYSVEVIFGNNDRWESPILSSTGCDNSSPSVIVNRKEEP